MSYFIATIVITVFAFAIFKITTKKNKPVEVNTQALQKLKG